MKIVTRQEAIEQKLTRYFTGKPCKHGHIAEKQLSNRTCIACLLPKKREWSNRPDVKLKGIERLNNFNKLNPDKRAARTRKRQAAKLQRTPPWLTEDQLCEMADLYLIAKMFQMYTGETYHVDHIVPLQGDNVSGLHVPWNLQILHYKENLQKSNKTT